MLNPVVHSHCFLFPVPTMYVSLPCCLLQFNWGWWSLAAKPKRKANCYSHSSNKVVVFFFFFSMKEHVRSNYLTSCQKNSMLAMFALSFPVNVLTALYFLIFLVRRLTLQHHSIVCYLLSRLLRSKVTCIY